MKRPGVSVWERLHLLAQRANLTLDEMMLISVEEYLRRVARARGVS